MLSFIAGGQACIGGQSPGGYTLAAAFMAQVVLTFFFLPIILGAALAGVDYPQMAGKAKDWADKRPCLAFSR